MKISTGSLKGRKIKGRVNPRMRPTSNKVRKALFDMLQGLVEGQAVLDLFSGTGALGLEALSRGAGRVVFVEKHRDPCRLLEQEVRRFGLSSRSAVLCKGVPEALRALSGKERFGLVFMDPPYAAGMGPSTLETLAASDVLKEGALVIWECHKKEKPPRRTGELHLLRVRDYGDTRIVVYRSGEPKKEDS